MLRARFSRRGAGDPSIEGSLPLRTLSSKITRARSGRRARRLALVVSACLALAVDPAQAGPTDTVSATADAATAPPVAVAPSLPPADQTPASAQATPVLHAATTGDVATPAAAPVDAAAASASLGSPASPPSPPAVASQPVAAAVQATIHSAQDVAVAPLPAQPQAPPAATNVVNTAATTVTHTAASAVNSAASTVQSAASSVNTDVDVTPVSTLPQRVLSTVVPTATKTVDDVAATVKRGAGAPPGSQLLPRALAPPPADVVHTATTTVNHAVGDAVNAVTAVGAPSALPPAQDVTSTALALTGPGAGGAAGAARDLLGSIAPRRTAIALPAPRAARFVGATTATTESRRSAPVVSVASTAGWPPEISIPVTELSAPLEAVAAGAFAPSAPPTSAAHTRALGVGRLVVLRRPSPLDPPFAGGSAWSRRAESAAFAPDSTRGAGGGLSLPELPSLPGVLGGAAASAAGSGHEIPAAILVALILVVPRLGRLLRPTPDLWRPLTCVSSLDRPG